MADKTNGWSSDATATTPASAQRSALMQTCWPFRQLFVRRAAHGCASLVKEAHADATFLQLLRLRFQRVHPRRRTV